MNLQVKQADELENILTKKFLRFLSMRAEAFQVLRRKPVQVDHLLNLNVATCVCTMFYLPALMHSIFCKIFSMANASLIGLYIYITHTGLGTSFYKSWTSHSVEMPLLRSDGLLFIMWIIYSLIQFNLFSMLVFWTGIWH